MYDNGHIIPTEEELETLPKIAGTMPWSAYLLCGAEFAERASYYGCKQVFKNFIRAPLPDGGNGAGAPPRGSQKTAGALGKGTVIASAMTDAFIFLAYALPIFGGWLADAHWGRFKTICWGVAICGVAYIIMIISAIPSVIQAGHAIGPFALSLYILAVGTAMFKPLPSSIRTHTSDPTLLQRRMEAGLLSTPRPHLNPSCCGSISSSTSVPSLVLLPLISPSMLDSGPRTFSQVSFTSCFQSYCSSSTSVSSNSPLEAPP